ncbi:U-box domain-containing protein 33-like isoform X2 [Quercus robur]|uniref:U-box domain-containing protein 33-like isoform X2 n=1 Tax=Quercus robur TaxID=38942 RepID=UPI002162CD66|nr:U-box domain-containing protein 33-like isoform X2 [Quercus robur]
MAMVSPVSAITQRTHTIRVQMASRQEIEGDSVVSRIEDIIYVAVAKDVKDSKSTLVWTLQKSGGKKVCIIHVHQPAQMIPLMGTKFPASSMKEQEVEAYREIERQLMQKTLDEYLLICRRMGVRAEKVNIEMDNIEKGIVELICKHGIRKLVMGAAADKHYSRRMMDLKSKKAIYVRQQAPAYCHIQFVCKGNLIHNREGNLHGADVEVASPLFQVSPNNETGQPNHLRSQSVTVVPTTRVALSNPAQDLFRRVRSVNIQTFGFSPINTEGLSAPESNLDADGDSCESDRLSGSSPHQGSDYSSFSSEVAPVPYVGTEGSENGLELSELHQYKEDLHQSSPPSVLDGSIDDTFYDQLEQAMAEARNAKREAFQETVKRGKAEKDAIDSIRRALKQRKEMEQALAKEKEELEKVNNLCSEVKEELEIALDQKSSMERQIAESEQMVKELEQKIISAVELLQNYKKERDELQTERDIALKEAEELRKKQGEASSTHMPQFFSEFSFSELDEATRNFDPSLKIGEGGYGNIYKGVLRHTQVAIKMLHSHSLQGPSEFQQEVDVLSKLRHPNLVTLIGACPDAWALIYEYLPNGSVEDRLSCKDNSPPLSWQIRIRIAAELCSALIFLHSCKPNSIIHGDLKPANILLDANFVSKLSDFGICRLLSQDESLNNNSTRYWKTDPKGTFAYMDPEFLSTAELTPKSDVYSFGIILLRLLTGRSALGITKEVQYALDSGNLKVLLDPLAGDWPFVQAEQLARLALRCCEINRRSRPDLGSDVWRVLEPMRASCGGSSSFRLGSEEHFQPPPYFICPIFHEVMQDPHVAADGFTYEAEALRGWLDSGHDTSPMTNVKLEHCNLVPNHALRSAIQEWLQQH